MTRVHSEDGFVEESQSFEWGLIAVNSRKSIYRPNETAEFEIVVLDRESFGVAGASVTLAVVFPNGETHYLSTENGEVLKTTSSGIYVSKMQVLGEGTYNVFAQAKAPNIDSSIQTSFEVRQNFSFDIERITPTKIDPANQPNNVKFAIDDFIKASKISVREFVPKEFEVFAKKKIVEHKEGDDEAKIIAHPTAIITETETEKIIEWKNVELENGALTLEYDYSVPDKKPWLYNLGPIEIIYSQDQNEMSFFEARSWMVAVDANPTTAFYFRNDNDFNGSEPMPNASASTDTFAQNNWGGFGMNDVTGSTSKTRANTSFTDAGNVAVAIASLTSPPLILQTISSGTWKMNGVFRESATNDDLQLRGSFYSWADSNDSRGVLILSPTNQGTEFGTADANRLLSATGVAVTFNRGDKLVAEVSYWGISPSSAVGTFTWGNGMDGNVLAPAAIRIAGDLNTGMVSPANNSSQVINTAFDVNALGSCRNYSCGDANVVLRYCVSPDNGCPTFYDMNTVSTSPLFISTGAASRRDDLLNASDINYFVFAVTGTINGEYLV
ncbi:MAG: hypothetical protein HYW50_02240, partial [Candidatus Diapherotrites archaeon]|nr:hypothetical protein [Candidatus Diapherotrites archaeon]